MLALTPVKKSTALLQTSITWVPSLRLSWFFVLIAAEFDELSENLSHRERFAHPMERCCVDCRRFLACFCLYGAGGQDDDDGGDGGYEEPAGRHDLPGSLRPQPITQKQCCKHSRSVIFAVA